MPTVDPLATLSEIVRGGRSTAPSEKDGVRNALKGLFGGVFHSRFFDASMLRDAYSLGGGDLDEGVPYAGLIHPDNATSGPYGGTSLVWFPGSDSSLIGLGVGTRGLSPDEGILTRPGHRRRIAALRRYLARRKVEAWTKADRSALNQEVPPLVRDRFPGFETTFKKYGREMYCNAIVPSDPVEALEVVKAFVFLYAIERGWLALKEHQEGFEVFRAALQSDLFAVPTGGELNSLLRSRRFVVLQGPPGTGKTRLADSIRKEHFDGRGMTVQFHPAVTYEDFVVGLSPKADTGQLSFRVRPGWLLQACAASKDAPFLLVIDEVNRADLGKVLGEAIYLFEPREVGGVDARSVQLPHPVNGVSELRIPENLFVLATMNTADRSIASLDLAIRRRFAFVPLPPDRSVLERQGLEAATEVFDRLVNVFVEHAPDDAFDLLPGHAYFLAASEGELRQRFRYELIPLLDEYLKLGLLGPASGDLQAVRDAAEDASR